MNIIVAILLFLFNVICTTFKVVFWLIANILEFLLIFLTFFFIGYSITKPDHSVYDGDYDN